jgi:CHAT domain-containing protein/tetratricopeptide (TPR) repeat protein
MMFRKFRAAIRVRRLTRTSSVVVVLAAVAGGREGPLVHPIAASQAPASAAGQDAQLIERAQAFRKTGDYTNALSLAEQALAIRERTLEADDLAVADVLHLVALLYDDRHEYLKAEAPNRRALAIREARLGPDHPDVALSLYNLAWLAKVRQDFAESEALYKRTLDIQERSLGPDHRAVMATLNDMAVLFNQRGDYDAALALHQRVLAARERTVGADDPAVALSLNNLARTQELRGQYAEAEALLRRSVSIYERSRGPDHPETAYALDGLARILSIEGNYADAEPLLQRALTIREARLGPEHTEVATSLNNLAVLYRDLGNYDRAVPLLLRDLAITEKKLGDAHAFLAPTLTNLAGIYAVQGQTDQAEAAYRRALFVQERALGATHASVGITLNRLGQFLLQTQPPASLDAEPLFERARSILETAFGPDHPAMAASLNGLAAIAARRGDRDRAVAHVRRALAIRELALGPNHFEVAESLERLATLTRVDDTAGAIALLSRAYDIRERHLDRNLPMGSERQKLGYLRLFADDTDEALTLARLIPADPRAIRLAVTTALRRKGRALDATADTVGTLRLRAAPADRALFDRVSRARAELAAWTMRGPAGGSAAVYRARLRRLEAASDQAESDLGARSAAYRAQSHPVTLEAIQAAIPAEAVLLEFVTHRPMAPPGAPRYVAFALHRDGDPRMVDLGSTAAIDRAMGAWRTALTEPHRDDERRLAREVDARVMAPVRAAINGARQLLIAPDGSLNLVPFGALVDEHDRRQIERFDLSYLTSGRDLLRLREAASSRSASVVVAAPAFGDPAVATDPSVGSSSSPRVDESRMFFGPLPGAADEVRALRPLLPGATFLVSDQATEAALRRLTGPRVLHIATHGFFLDSDQHASSSANPLLRSGLALTGANQGRQGNDDGVLTALEAASLDLWGTKLVVLSACDTGVGEVRQGDGVHGLRRAFVVAGAESQLLSLWPVSDRSTRDLMVAYYASLTRGVGRAAALRAAQLQALRHREQGHPFYWAGFIQSGEWANLDGRR